MTQGNLTRIDSLSVAELDPLILEAAREVDGALLDWALSLSPRERLRACSNATAALGKFANVPSATRIIVVPVRGSRTISPRLV